MLKITPYGAMTGVGILLGSSVFDINLKIMIILIASALIQSQLCSHCNRSFNMVSFLAIFPLLTILFNNCKEAYKIILGFSIIAGISRLGCYFAGCCTGKETDKNNFSIKYEGEYRVNSMLNKSRIYVQPTVFLEIFLQLLFVLIIIKANRPFILFGLLNALLVLSSDFWRLGQRAKNKKILPLSVMSLTLFALIAKLKCSGFVKPNITLSTSIHKVIFTLIIVLIVSNDITISSLNSQNTSTFNY